ncbi:MAG: transcriptional regulator [Candidatus Staskawiczbacteria bacterium RIFCSPHIGHO2_02_FULL_34_10]|uniref:Probable transcriptional regulatory protein A3C58_02075 n=1 Tax=Candidatus Staskawiczbacteria bacterium RIFCSPHIGHO2_02_FULL_34_10 TaxID=1802205 RepID=A0A1G2HYI1_9BACT|nr:MAG: transcriptional regulator [Candidatus Staskawiczbacteria bacterium RIFCSPHIGHO2_02_FULL_34_10]
MSGHSHFKTVAATKNANDAKRGKLFSKLARVITIVVKEGGPDPLINTKLKTAIEQTKKFNMPKENIERAIKKGTGELVGENLEEVSFEGLGPGGVAIIMDGITDNKNRTLGEIKGILSQYNGKMAGEGAIKWMFKRKGFIVINPETKLKEELELIVIEVGADDVKWRENMLCVYTKPEDLEIIKKILEEKGLIIESSSLDWVAKEEVIIDEKDKEKSQKLFEALDENDAIQDIYSNLKN